MERVWWFTLWLLVGLAACIGTILAMFAWTVGAYSTRKSSESFLPSKEW